MREFVINKQETKVTYTLTEVPTNSSLASYPLNYFVEPYRTSIDLFLEDLKKSEEIKIIDITGEN